jgi:hypothetical protein
VATVIVTALALAALFVAAALLRREPSGAARTGARVSAVLGFLVALAVAGLAGKAGTAALAIALLGGAVLPLTLLAQLWLLRVLVRR